MPLEAPVISSTGSSAIGPHCGIAIIAGAMDPAKKRKIRLVVALSAEVLLATALVYTSFSASTEAREPSDIIGTESGETYDLTGKVVPGTIERTDENLAFHISDRDGSDALPVTYTGTVPDPFRDGREVIVTGKL